MHVRRQILSTVVFASLLLLSSFLSGCSLFSEERQKPPEGRCFTNTDCDEGFACRNTYCEDIYFPRRKMKPY